MRRWFGECRASPSDMTTSVHGRFQMPVILSMCLWVLLPFLILRILGYEKALELGSMVCAILGVYFFSFFTGLLVTFVFESGSSNYFRNYEKIMPRMYASEFKINMPHDAPLIAWTQISLWLLIDLLRISVHFIFTYSKITMWIPMLMGLFIIYIIVDSNYSYFLPPKPTYLDDKDKYAVDVFGNRLISFEEEEKEIADFLAKAKQGRIG
jgi:hypothetical protein